MKVIAVLAQKGGVGKSMLTRSLAVQALIDGRKAATLRGPTLAQDFMAMVQDYIEKRFGQARQMQDGVLEPAE